MSKLKRIIGKFYYPLTIWAITVIFSPLTFYFFFETILKNKILVTDNVLSFTIYPFVVPISTVLSIPGFALFLSAYILCYRSKLSNLKIRLILSCVNSLNIAVSFGLTNDRLLLGELISFPIIFWLVSMACIWSLPILRNKS
jgi:hypothetical protein